MACAHGRVLHEVLSQATSACCSVQRVSSRLPAPIIKSSWGIRSRNTWTASRTPSDHYYRGLTADHPRRSPEATLRAGATAMNSSGENRARNMHLRSGSSDLWARPQADDCSSTSVVGPGLRDPALHQVYVHISRMHDTYLDSLRRNSCRETRRDTGSQPNDSSCQSVWRE